MDLDLLVCVHKMKVIKRDGSLVEFDTTKIHNAILKAMLSAGVKDDKVADKIAQDAKKAFREICCTAFLEI